MWRFAVALIFSTLAFAQDSSDLVVASKSPLLLARYIASHATVDWTALSQALGIEPPSRDEVRCGHGGDDQCSAQIVRVLKPDQQIIIVQSPTSYGHDVYLRYLLGRNGEWKFTGERITFVKEFPRRHEIVRLGGKPFLKISSDHSQIGSSMTQEVEDWFDLTQDGFEPVFSFSQNGSYSDFSFSVWRSFTSQAIPISDEKIDLILNVKFSGPGMSLLERYVGIYERHVGEKKFTIRRAYGDFGRRSEMPKEDFEQIGGVDIDLFTLSNARMLVYAFSGLQKIAQDADKEGREWLQSVLAHTDDCPEKRKLLDLLAKR